MFLLPPSPLALLPEKRPDERLTSFTPLRIPLQRSFLQTQNPLNRQVSPLFYFCYIRFFFFFFFFDLPHSLSSQYVFQFLPSGLSTRLFIRVMKHYQKCEQCVYWRYGVFLSLPPSKKEDSHTFILVELDNERLIINLRVRSASAAVASGVLLVLTGSSFIIIRHHISVVVVVVVIVNSPNSILSSQGSFKISFMSGTISLSLLILFLFLVLIVCVHLWTSSRQERRGKIH